MGVDCSRQILGCGDDIDTNSNPTRNNMQTQIQNDSRKTKLISSNKIDEIKESDFKTRSINLINGYMRNVERELFQNYTTYYNIPVDINYICCEYYIKLAKIDVNIKLVNRTEFWIENIPSTANVLELKKIIFLKKPSYNPNMQRLVYNNMELKDNKSLTHYNIHHESSICLVVRMMVIGIDVFSTWGQGLQLRDNHT
eukprot:548416_1